MNPLFGRCVIAEKGILCFIFRQEKEKDIDYSRSIYYNKKEHTFDCARRNNHERRIQVLPGI